MSSHAPRDSTARAGSGSVRSGTVAALAVLVAVVVVAAPVVAGVAVIAGGAAADATAPHRTGTCVVGDGSRLSVLSTDVTDQFSYRIVVDGTARAIRSGPNSADDEVVERNPDGTVSITGSTGSGAGDAYRISGEILSVEVLDSVSGYRIELDGRDVTDLVTRSPNAGESCLFGQNARLSVLSTDVTDQFSYRIVVDGTARAIREGPNSADDEVVERNPDGTVSITGSTGSGAGDAYRITGRIVSVEILDSVSGYRIELDGRDVTAAATGLTPPAPDPGGTTSDDRVVGDGSRLSILSTVEGDEFSYRIVVRGDAEPIRGGANSADDGDDVSVRGDSVVISGTTGNGAGDAYRITGEVVSFDVRGAAGYRVELDGRDVTAAVGDVSGDGGGAGDDSAVRDVPVAADGARLAVLSTDEDEEFSYRIVVEGRAEAIRSGPNSADAETEDVVRDVGGVVVITGSTGSGAGDAYRITGEVVAYSVDGSSAYRLELDGRDVTDEIPRD